MHSDTNSSRRLGPLSIHTLAGVSCQTGVSEGFDGETNSPRVRRRRAEAEDRQGGRGLEERCCGAGEVKKVL